MSFPGVRKIYTIYRNNLQGLALYYEKKSVANHVAVNQCRIQSRYKIKCYLIYVKRLVLTYFFFFREEDEGTSLVIREIETSIIRRTRYNIY